MVKVLGILDFVAAALLFALYYKIGLPKELVFIVALLLTVKGIIFIMDFTSFIDIAAGILLIISLYATVPSLIILPIALFVGFKGVMSLPAN